MGEKLRNSNGEPLSISSSDVPRFTTVFTWLQSRGFDVSDYTFKPTTTSSQYMTMEVEGKDIRFITDVIDGVDAIHGKHVLELDKVNGEEKFRHTVTAIVDLMAAARRAANPSSS